MATTTQKDDDILVLSESSPSDDFDFHFDFGDTTSEVPQSEDLASSSENTEHSQENTPQIEPQVGEINFNFLGENSSKGEEILKEISSEIDNSQEMNVKTSDSMKSAVSDFFSKTESEEIEGEKPQEVTENKEVASEEQTTSFIENLSQSDKKPQEVSQNFTDVHESMNDILAGTIAKLMSRKGAIADDKTEKQAQVEKIKAEISDLQSQKKELEKEIASLDAETAKIDENKASLEKMKM